jgi:hypothetical protein
MALRAASVAAPGGAVVHVEHAPPHEEHVFSRDHVVVSTETGMVDRMGGLRQETIAKNAELQRQIVRVLAPASLSPSPSPAASTSLACDRIVHVHAVIRCPYWWWCGGEVHAVRSCP